MKNVKLHLFLVSSLSSVIPFSFAHAEPKSSLEIRLASEVEGLNVKATALYDATSFFPGCRTLVCEDFGTGCNWEGVTKRMDVPAIATAEEWRVVIPSESPGVCGWRLSVSTSSVSLRVPEMQLGTNPFWHTLYLVPTSGDPAVQELSIERTGAPGSGAAKWSRRQLEIDAAGHAEIQVTEIYGN